MLIGAFQGRLRPFPPQAVIGPSFTAGNTALAWDDRGSQVFSLRIRAAYTRIRQVEAERIVMHQRPRLRAKLDEMLREVAADESARARDKDALVVPVQ